MANIDPAHLAKLTNVPLSPPEINTLANNFAATLETISTLNELDTTKVDATPQVIDLKNVFRPDIIDQSHSFTQAEALANSKHTHQGYFVVKAVINEA